MDNDSSSSVKSVSYGTILKLIFSALALLAFIAVGRVLLYPGQQLPTFDTLIEFLKFNDTLVITKFTILGDIRESIIAVLDALPFVGTETAQIIAEPFIWLLFPFELIYFVLVNLWNIFMYVVALLVWATGVDIFGIGTESVSSIVNVVIAMSGVAL